MPRRAFRPEDLYLLHPVGDPQLSPDGALVAYVVGTHDEAGDEVQTRVWVAPYDGSAPPRPFSAGPKDHSPRWSPDGATLLFVGDRGAGAQLLLAPLAGGEPRVLTEAEHGAGQPAWSPDGSRVAYVARVGKGAPPADA